MDGLQAALYVETTSESGRIEVQLANRPNSLGVHVLLPQPSPEQIDELRVIADAVAEAGFNDTCLRQVIQALSLTPLPNPEVALLEQYTHAALDLAFLAPVEVWRWSEDTSRPAS